MKAPQRLGLVSAVVAALAVALWGVQGRDRAPPPRTAPERSASVGGAALTGGAAPERAPSPDVSLAGLVLGVDGRPVEGAELRLIDERTGGVFAGLSCACAPEAGAEAAAAPPCEWRARCGCGVPSELHELLQREPSLVPAAVSRTGPGGVFSFTLDAGASQYTLAGEWGGEELRRINLTLPQFGLTLRAWPRRPSFEVRGQVLDEDLRGVPGAPVLLVGDRDTAARRAVTDVQGQFAFAGVHDADLVVTAVDGLPVATAPVTSGGAPLTLQVAPWKHVVGQVVRGGAPAAGISLSVDAPCAAPVRSDGLGRFAFELPLGTFSVSAEDGRWRGLARVTVEPGHRPEALTVELLEAGRLDLQVTDGRGHPLPNARVSWVPRSRGAADSQRLLRALPFGETDSAGRFSIEGDPGGDYDVSVSADRHQPETRALRWASGEVLRERFELQPGALIEGVVVDDEGHPVAGAELSARSCEAGGTCSDSPITVTAADGAFSAHDLPEGPLRLVVAHERLRAQEVRAVLPARALRVVLRPVLHLRGTVLDERGAPAPRVRVLLDAIFDDRLGRRAIEAGAQGQFEFDVHREGRVRLSATRADPSGHTSASAALELELGASEPGPLTLRLSTGGSLSGTVVDAAGVVVEGARVFAEPADVGAAPAPAGVRRSLREAAAHVAQATSGAGGGFLLRGLVEGAHLLWAEGGEGVAAEPVRVTVGAEKLVLRLGVAQPR